MIISISTYSLALFEIAHELEKTNSFYDELREFNHILNQDQEVKRVLTTSVGDYRLFDPVWESLESHFSQEVLSFLKIIQEASLLHDLDRILKEYRDLMQKEGMIHKVDIRSPQLLSRAEKEAIVKEIKKHYHQKLDINYRQDPSLISGLYVRVDNDVYDTSIKNKFKQILAQGGLDT